MLLKAGSTAFFMPIERGAGMWLKSFRSPFGAGRTKLPPPSHQSWISPEKSNFDAKVTRTWWAMGVELFRPDGMEGRLVVRSFSGADSYVEPTNCVHCLHSSLPVWHEFSPKCTVPSAGWPCNSRGSWVFGSLPKGGPVSETGSSGL